MAIQYTMRDCDTWATVYDGRDGNGPALGTLRRPLGFAPGIADKDCWVLTSRDGETVMRRKLRPTRIAIERTLRG